jgi:hypothetical protein
VTTLKQCDEYLNHQPACPRQSTKPIKGSFDLKILLNWHHKMVTSLIKIATFLTRVLVLGNLEAELAI